MRPFFSRAIVTANTFADDLTACSENRQDTILVRLYRELYRKLNDSSAAHVSDVKCSVHPWGGAWEIEKYFKENL